MRFARREKSEVDINITPLIDVVFLLLIFFMVSTTFTKETHLSIDLPEASADPLKIAKDQIDVSISKAGHFAVNEVALVNDSLETLKRAIEKISQGDHTIPFVITADAAATHQSVVTAMDAAGQMGFIHLSITTKSAELEE
jgi:biopolymer transport protein ExbD|tara:strand:- start:1653 stop:2075 length:423 start_codon:yes stop_codon:yes gene_type:complete